MKKFTSAPLPFQGQKRNFAKHYAKAVANYPTETIFVDLFGGSGLLSHITKRVNPGCRVIYNDFDGYAERVKQIPKLNALLDDIRPVVAEVEKLKAIKGEQREKIISIVEAHEARGFSDYLSLSQSLLFSMHYVKNLAELKKETLYNRVASTNYNADRYLDGLEIVSKDYRLLFDEFKDNENVFFICDPPYLSTDASSYSGYWKLIDYLDVMDTIREHQFAFFTSDKSNLPELLEWMASRSDFRNPLEHAERHEIQTIISQGDKNTYTDMMFIFRDKKTKLELF